MTRLTAKDFAPELLELYDGYAHGKINRREFLDRAALFTFGGLTASALLASLSPNYALAEQVKFTDPDIVADYVTYPSPKGNGTVRGYLVRPAKAAGKLPAVVVVHENRGLNPYIEDVARRLAKAGFIALAPDGLTSVGGYPGNDEKGVALQQTVDPDQTDERLLRRHRMADAPRQQHRKSRHHRLLLRRWRDQRSSGGLPELGAAVSSTAANRKPRTYRGSRRRSCCTSARWIHASTKAGRPTRQP